MAVSKVAALATAGLVLFFILMLLLGVLVSGPQNQQGGPAAQGLPGVVCAPPGKTPDQAVAGFANDQLQNAGLIVAAGDEVGAPQRAQVIAIATAMQESGLHNLNHGDLDSLGLFQQRASWGPVAVREDPKATAKLFYARLLSVPGWQTMPLTEAAQRVQVSALPDAYAKWESAADQVLGDVLHITCEPGGGSAPGGEVAPGQPVPASPLTEQVIARATAQVGKPYAWGGGSATGPTHGISDGGGAADKAGDTAKIGFDCSGLMVYAFAGIGITVPHQTQAIWAQFPPPITNRAQIQPGDMILLSSNGQPSGIDHVGLYLGGGRVVDAPESGLNVRIEPNIWANPYWSAHFIGAVQATTTVGSRA
jgi:cell wall-associated NlpC family hydrolase